MTQQIWHLTVPAGEKQSACDLLTGVTGLSRSAIKQAMRKGAVWRRSANGKKRRRLRKATSTLYPGQRLSLYHDPELLQRQPPQARLHSDCRRYSVWFKPAGLLSQGNRFGDHCALLRQVEQYFSPRRPVFLLHRLDREASGLVLIAHDREAAARLSRLFADRKITKLYRVWVRGDLTRSGPQGQIVLPLDGKEATTNYQCLHYHQDSHCTEVAVTLTTGRRHQIRRHLAAVGHPVLGDPRYGTRNSDPAGLRLCAVRLAFLCPLTAIMRCFSLEKELPPLD